MPINLIIFCCELFGFFVQIKRGKLLKCFFTKVIYWLCGPKYVIILLGPFPSFTLGWAHNYVVYGHQ